MSSADPAAAATRGCRPSAWLAGLASSRVALARATSRGLAPGGPALCGLVSHGVALCRLALCGVALSGLAPGGLAPRGVALSRVALAGAALSRAASHGVALCRLALCGVALSVLLSACAAPDRPVCIAGAPALVFNLYFGASIPGRAELTAQEWRSFLHDTVTPVLPGGYTVMEAEGAWMNPRSHQTIHEPTKVLAVALPDAAESWAAVNKVRTAYQTMFHQQLVGLTAQPGCAEF